MSAYTALPGFENLVLEESFVLGITATPASVIFTVEFVLTPDHPAYAEPPADENDCYRLGQMRFAGVRRLEWSQQGAMPATDATGEVDYGHIDDMRFEATTFELEGDWGRMIVEAESVGATLDDEA